MRTGDMCATGTISGPVSGLSLRLLLVFSFSMIYNTGEKRLWLIAGAHLERYNARQV